MSARLTRALTNALLAPAYLASLIMRVPDAVEGTDHRYPYGDES